MAAYQQWPVSKGGDGPAQQWTNQGAKGKGCQQGKENGGWQQPQQQQQWQQPTVPEFTEEQFQNHLHDVIFAPVETATKLIAHMDTEWTEDQIIKRVVKQMYKAAVSPDLRTMRWDEACKELIDRMMNGYSAACSTKDWFYYIDLPPVFFAAFWEILQVTGQAAWAVPDQIQELIVYEYEDQLHKIVLDRALWTVTSEIFSDEKTRTKVNKVLNKAYWPSVDFVMQSGFYEQQMYYRKLPPHIQLQAVEIFIRQWMDDSINRVWMAIENVESVLTEEIVEELFRRLIAPFGVDDTFSCIPPTILGNIGRPPPDWVFLARVVEELFASWGVSTKKRKQPFPGAAMAMDAGAGAAAGTGSELLDKAMMEVTTLVFSEEKVQAKVYKALTRSYTPSLNKVLAETGGNQHAGNMAQKQVLQRVEAFMKQWIDDSISRAWIGMEDAEAALTPEIVEELFRCLVAPYGAENAFSCIPDSLTGSVGRPPPDWNYIPRVVKELFTAWEARGGNAPKRRKMLGDAAGPGAVAMAPAAGTGGTPGKGGGAKKCHPRCTSAEDCIGSADDCMVRHVVDGGGGDIYCFACWEWFCSKNPDLEGVPVE